MDTHTTKFKVRLGLFILGGLLFFIITIFLIGKQKNLFNPVFKLTTTFSNISGLQVGSNIRFSGINVGTVDNITIINDSTVQVDMLIRRNIKQFIKADCEAGISSAGIIGDRILVITQGSNEGPLVKEGQHIAAREPVEPDAIMASLQVTANNAEVISYQLGEIMIKINNGNGTLGRLIQDSSIAENINQTIVNLKRSSKGLNDNMNAAKENFLFKGYFHRKQKAADKKKADALEKVADDKKKVDALEKKAVEQKADDKKKADALEKKAVKQEAADKKKADALEKKAVKQEAKDKKKADAQEQKAAEQKAKDEKK